MSLNLSALPSLPTLDTSSLSVPTVAEVGDVLVTALDTAGEAATVVVASARRRPGMAIGIISIAAVALLALMFVRRRRQHASPALTAEQPPRIVAA